MGLSEFSECFGRRLSALLGDLPSWVVRGLREQGWRGFAWQWLKRRLAEAFAACAHELCSLRAVYVADLHGAEHVVGEMGGKDIDIILDCDDELDVEGAERAAEKLVAGALSRLLGDPYEVLGVPNMIELHPASGYLGRRLLSAGYARPLRLRGRSP